MTIQSTHKQSLLLNPVTTLRTNFLHILALWGVVVAQPLYALFEQYLDFFVAHDAHSIDVVLLAFSLSVGLPMILALPMWVVRSVNRNAGALVHHFMLTILLMLFALQLLNKIERLPDILIMILAAVLSIGFLSAYLNSSKVREGLSWLGFSIPLFPILFLVFSPVKQILFDAETTDQDQQIARPSLVDTPVVFLLFDELPLVSLMNEDHEIDAIRYPNFSGLSEDAYWFRNYTINSPFTKLSVPTILSGRYAVDQRAMLAKNHEQTLFSLLGPSYRIVSVGLSKNLVPQEFQKFDDNSISHSLVMLMEKSLMQPLPLMLLDMTVVYLHMVLPKSYANWLPPVTDNWNQFVNLVGFNFPSKGAYFDQFMEMMTVTSRPTLYYLHSKLTHNPWELAPSGRRYGEKDMPGYIRDRSIVDKVEGFGGKRWSNDEWLVTQGYQRHLLEVSRTDAMVGEVVGRLKALGIYDKSLIIVTSDHGCSFEPGNRNRGNRKTAPGDTMSVPLIVKLPFQKEAAVSDENMEAIDLLPTLADILQFKIPQSVDGTSIFDTSVPKRDMKTMIYPRNKSELSEFTAKATNTEKYKRLDAKLAIFGSGQTKPNGYFSIGPYGDLVDEKVEASMLVEDKINSVTVRFEEHNAFNNVDIDNSEYIPVHVSGRLLSGAPANKPLHLAISINNTVRAVTRTYRKPGSETTQFYAMLPEQVMKNGRSDIAFYVISKDDDNQTRLSKVVQQND